MKKMKKTTTKTTRKVGRKGMRGGSLGGEPRACGVCGKKGHNRRSHGPDGKLRK